MVIEGACSSEQGVYGCRGGVLLRAGSLWLSRSAKKSVPNSSSYNNPGAQLVKYNYSNYKRTRRLFWISETGEELRWGKVKSGTDFSKVELKDCIGIIYGPVTTTFVRCTDKQDQPYCCFSLLFMGRTLDLATYGDMISVWFLGLQYLISRYGQSAGSMPTLSDSQFVQKKIQYKLQEKAHGKVGEGTREGGWGFVQKKIQYIVAGEGARESGRGGLCGEVGVV